MAARMPPAFGYLPQFTVVSHDFPRHLCHLCQLKHSYRRARAKIMRALEEGGRLMCDRRRPPHLTSNSYFIPVGFAFCRGGRTVMTIVTLRDPLGSTLKSFRVVPSSGRPLISSRTSHETCSISCSARRALVRRATQC